MSVAEIQFHEDVLPPSPDNQYVSEYFQINSERGKAWHSPSMGDRSFAFDLETFKNTPLYVPHFDDTELQPAFPVLGASTLGLMGSLQGQGPFLAVSALFPVRV